MFLRRRFRFARRAKRFARRRVFRHKRRFTRRTHRFRRVLKRNTGRTPRSVNYQKRTIQLSTSAPASQTGVFPPVAQANVFETRFSLTQVQAALSYTDECSGGNAAGSMFELYQMFKIGKATVTWSHSPGKGQSEASPVTPYSGSYFSLTGESLPVQAGTADASLPNVTNLPFGRKHGAWFGRRTWRPNAMAEIGYKSVGIADPALNAIVSPRNGWFYCEKNGLDTPSTIEFTGPVLLLPGMRHTGPLFANPGAVTGYNPGVWTVSISIDVLFKGAKYGWRASQNSRATGFEHHAPWGRAVKEAQMEEEFGLDTNEGQPTILGTVGATLGDIALKTATKVITKHLEL